LETPAEPSESKFHLTVKQRFYPAWQKLVGLYWAYLGPEPLPLIPNFDVWFRRMGIGKFSSSLSSTAIGFKRWKTQWIQRICRFFTRRPPGVGERFKNTTRGLTDDVEKFEFYEVPYGLMKRRTYKNGMLDEHPV